MSRFVLLFALAGCMNDHYECRSDRDCNLGTGGRCELDHHCTAYDPTCDTLRSFTPHSGSESGVCYDGRVAVANPCAGGQPPAIATGCAAQVCADLPACCESGWTDACAVDAELRCDLICDTRIAITATRGAREELWDLRYNGTAWTGKPRTDRQTLLAYLAPAPGTIDPRLAGFGPNPGQLAVGDGDAERDFFLDPTRDYHDASTLDFDRDARDTVVVSSQDLANGANQYVDVVKLDDGSVREVNATAASRDAWGDIDHDAYPDGIAAAGTRYTFLTNLDDTDHSRALDTSVSSGFGGVGNMMSPGPPGARSFEWADLDGDHLLDMVAFGNSLRVHLGGDRLNDIPVVNIDCDPPIYPTGACDTSLASFAGTVLPGDSVVAATWPTQAVYRFKVMKGPPPGVARTAIALAGPDVCPAMTCSPIMAIVARDLDGDHQLDLVAIDAQLHVFVGFAKDGLATLAETRPITTATTFTSVRTSVSGAPR